MASNSIFLFDLTTSNENIANEFYTAIDRYPIDEPSYFNVELTAPNELNGQYVLVQNVEETYYNPELRSFDSRTALKASIVYFDIVGTQLEVWGNKANCNKLVFVLSNLLQNLTIKAVEISLQELIDKLYNFKVKVGRVCFEDFLFTDDIVGNFNVDLSSYGDAYAVLDKYRQKISRMTVTLPCDNDSLKLCITTKGTVTVFRQRDQLDDDILDLLHNLLLDKER